MNSDEPDEGTETTRLRVAVIGASVRAAAFSLVKAGHLVVAADLFADADLQQVCPVTRIDDYPSGAAQWLAATSCDGWLYTGAWENYPELIDQLAARRPLWGNSGAAVQRARNLLFVQDTLLGAGLLFPETRPGTCAPAAGERWLFKTGRGGGGSGVFRAEELRGLDCSTGYWQRLVPGTTGSAVYLLGTDHCELVGITQQLVGAAWTGARPFQYCGNLAPWSVSPDVTAQLNRLGQLLRAEFGLRGLVGIDVVLAEEQVWLIEINPRPTAAMEVVERLTARNLVAEQVALLNPRGTQAPTVPVRLRLDTFSPRVAGKVILFAKQELLVTEAASARLHELAGDWRRPALADIPGSGARIARGEPVITLLTEAGSPQEVEIGLRQEMARVEEILSRGEAT